MSETGAGYNIPISLSAADSYSVPQTISAPTYFVFRSAGAKVGGDIETPVTSMPEATATSSAALRDAVSQTTQNKENTIGGLNMTTAILLGAGVLAVAIVAAVMIYKR